MSQPFTVKLHFREGTEGGDKKIIEIPGRFHDSDEENQYIRLYRYQEDSEGNWDDDIQEKQIIIPYVEDLHYIELDFEEEPLYNHYQLSFPRVVQTTVHTVSLNNIRLMYMMI